MTGLIAENVRQVELFPSRLHSYDWGNDDGTNKELRQLILQEAELDSGVQTTNVGGWHSRKNLHEWSSAAVGTLLSRIRTFATFSLKFVHSWPDGFMSEDWKIQAWANINRFGDYNKYHTHIRNSNLWSGIYYLDSGVTAESGVRPARTVFVDQYEVTLRENEHDRNRFFVEPRPGLMLLFPSSLGHRVERHHGGGNRITIAFNLKNDRLTTINYEIEANNAKSKVEPKERGEMQ